MKKVILLLAIALLATASVTLANRITIKVSNFQFTPATVNVKLGDTIIWKWVSGTHTTTSLTIPSGARAWDKPIDASHLSFKYRVTKVGVYKYQCTFHSSVMKGTINVSASSAADAVDLSITENNTRPVLSWKTEASDETSYFSIQRSTDANQFTEIARVKPNAANQYSFTDDHRPNTKYIYYQLAITHADGSQSLSAIQMFANTHITATLITSLSPNPVSGSGHVMFQFNADKEGTMLARLYNQSGTLLQQEEVSAMKGLNNGHFHLDNLSPGAYYIIFSLGGISEKHIISVK